MFYIIYKTTNLVNKKFYIGKHKTTSLNFDGYLGSGKLIKMAIKKYGINNFLRETLFVFDNDLDCSIKEREILSENFLIENHNNCYNLHVGGTGGAGSLIFEKGQPTIKKCNISDESKKRMSELNKNSFVCEYENGVIKRLKSNHPDVLSGKAKTRKTNSAVYILNGAKVCLPVNDTRVLSGEVKHCLKGIKTSNSGFKENECLFLTETNEVIKLTREEGINRNLRYMNTGTSIYTYSDGKNKRLPTNHPDVLSGIAISINKNRKQEKIQCPHCQKIGSSTNMKRYHFNNCKFNQPKQ